ncbi:MAG: DUF547 domain-containing protein [Bacteroidota bacterium]
MKRIALVFVVWLYCAGAYSQGLSAFTQKADKFFKEYVSDGRVKYGAVASDFSQMTQLYEQIGGMDLSASSDLEKKAFYINSYNLIVVYQIAKYYEFHKKSPMDQSGFFDKMKHKVAGEMMTLNVLEIRKLLFAYKDARIHFVLACAAKSCPPLASFAYTPSGLEKQLENRTRLSINDNDWLKVSSKDNKVLLSKIFDWYKRDFTSDGQTVLGFINMYRKQSIPASYQVAYYEYDWNLNSN